MKRIFISVPYYSPDPNIIEERVKQTEEYFMFLLKAGFCPVAPIIVGHHLIKTYGIESKFEFWEDYCMSELKSCDEVHVLCLNDWCRSVGVKAEIEIAESLKIPVKKIN